MRYNNIQGSLWETNKCKKSPIKIIEEITYRRESEAYYEYLLRMSINDRKLSDDLDTTVY